MCEPNSYDEDLEQYGRSAELTRRQFGLLTAGAGMAMLVPRAANAVPVTESNVEIRTPDGTADAYFVHPASGTHPGVLVWPDIVGLRASFRAMGKRLAESGYAVLVVNQYYRQRHAPVVGEGASYADEATRSIVRSLAGDLTPTTQTTDAIAFTAWLDRQPVVDTQRKLGTTGYCMGGPFTMRTAASVPGRVGAAASFHGGGLVTDRPDSPHLLVPKIKAQYLFAIAESDDKRDLDTKNVLRAAFSEVGVPAEIEVYEGAAHGWCVLDSRAYNEQQAERAWGRLLALFGRALA